MFQPMFVPPRHHAGIHWFARTFVPHLGRLFGNVHRLHAAPGDLARLEVLRSHRAILSPNHPTETDPIVVFWLARNLGLRFHYLATRETLEGPRGWLLNRIGVYSVIRGFPDRESIRMTRRLLAEEDRQVVIFPEGLVYEHNDRLLHFQSGVAQMGFWALDDLAKNGRDARLPVVPLAIKYHCLAPPEPAMERGLAVLEARLGVPPKGSRYERLRRLGSQVVATLERQEGLKPDETVELTERIAVVRRRVLERVARAIGASLDESQPPGEQLHLLTVQLRQWAGTLPEQSSAYEQRLHRQKLSEALPLYAELVRLHNTVAVTGDYVAAEPTAERFLEVLGRLQKEVLGRVLHQAPLGAIVRVGEPIWLDERYPAYRQSKRETVAAVTGEMQESIRAMLRELSGAATPITLE
ncbi:MAG: 1-acyl-sn-glycerol-3-phosphate acyltransferase [Armatimonadota bacterium]